MEVTICQKCRNYLGDLSCQAFKKIPKEILREGNSHSQPLPGQKNDIVFEPLDNGTK